MGRSALIDLLLMVSKKKDWMEVGGWGELYPSFFLDFWNCFNFAKPLSMDETMNNTTYRLTIPAVLINLDALYMIDNTLDILDFTDWI